jgi:hypothetical protein
VYSYQKELEMEKGLEEIRESTRPALERWLSEAMRKRAALGRELRDLDVEIARARSWLGDSVIPTSRMTLHAAMELVLREGGNVGMKAGELARVIADRDLYRKGTGEPAGMHQVQARVSNYDDVFVRENGLIKLRHFDS